uniref:Uncharacterized protein n=1 Tax=Candidatus Kentrum sp. FW TaxID=2126338 RepID=A0A450U1Z9_9GAMM|nr:MAG: hypothetical protein BECKFW1821C_GA0114237_110811 [Candidatus Kentron sp. FW]
MMRGITPEDEIAAYRTHGNQGELGTVASRDRENYWTLRAIAQETCIGQ